MSVYDNSENLKILKKNVANFKKAYIKVGIQGNAGLNKDGEPILKYAQYNEFGIGVPERSFIRSTADAKKNEWQKRLEKGLEQLLDNKKGVLQALSEVGLAAVNDIKEKITNAKNDPMILPNAQATVEKKKSSSPLIDTGAMRNAVRYVFENI